jgi:hypothetical protein
MLFSDDKPVFVGRIELENRCERNDLAPKSKWRTRRFGRENEGEEASFSDVEAAIIAASKR